MSVEVLGSVNLDLVAYVDDFPSPGETILAAKAERFLGGKGANQAVAAARLGASTSFRGFVGSDSEGRWVLDQLRAERVDVDGMVTLDHEGTGLALILVNHSGENVITVVSGANRSKATALTSLRRDGAAAAVVTQFESPLALVEAFLTGSPAGAHRILNAAPFVPEGRALFGHASVVVVNQGELLGYASSTSSAPGTDELLRAARSLLSRASQTVVVTLGEAGALAVTAARAMEVLGRRTQPVDTTGAGDCFCGALAAELSRGADLAEALRFAALAASLSVERRGAAPSMPRLVEVRGLMNPSA